MAPFLFSMKLETERLILRKPTLKDAEDLSKNGHEKIMPRLTQYLPYPFTVRKARKLIKDFWLNKKKGISGFCIFLKKENKVVGIVDIYNIDKKHKKAKIGCWIGKNYRGKGLASEAVGLALLFAWNNLHLNKLSTKRRC